MHDPPFRPGNLDRLNIREHLADRAGNLSRCGAAGCPVFLDARRRDLRRRNDQNQRHKNEERQLRID
ncbi:hypothetical protein D3C74_323540 [compost metagenome]